MAGGRNLKVETLANTRHATRDTQHPTPNTQHPTPYPLPPRATRLTCFCALGYSAFNINYAAYLNIDFNGVTHQGP